MGNGIKMPTEVEKDLISLIRKGIYLRNEVKAGTTLNKTYLSVKRPAGGIPPKYLDKIIGRNVKFDLKKDQILKWSDLED